ncbi:MAG: T9SS type A sorting domain-containing protein [Bacteroidia bacterium]
MKRAVLYFAFLFAAFNYGNAQTSTYYPLPDSSTVWIGKTWVSDGSSLVDETFYNVYISGDTTIGPHTYHKLLKNGMETCAFCPTPGGTTFYGHYYGVFRQDIPNRKVYTYEYGKDTLAYDFNLNAGDTLSGSVLLIGPTVYIQSVDSVMIGSQYHKRYWINGCSYSLIEGVGSTFGLHDYITCPFEAGADLWCMQTNGSTAWSNGSGSCALLGTEEREQPRDQLFITQNPFSTETMISSEAGFRNATLLLYDSSGQMIKQIGNISGKSYLLQRDELPNGIFYLRMVQSGRNPIAEKLVIIGN